MNVMKDPDAVAWCQAVPAFKGLNPGECHQLVDVARERTFAPGQKVIEQGQSSQYLWILLEGRCDVVRASKHNGEMVLAELAQHGLFGELSFFSPAPHSASVVARTPVKLLCISRSDYDDMIRDGVPAAYKLAYNIVEHVASKLRRMDERVAELSAHGEDHDAEGKLPEWRRFREKLFDGWNL